MVFTQVAGHAQLSWSAQVSVQDVSVVLVPSVHVPAGQKPLAHSVNAAHALPIFVWPQFAPLIMAPLLVQVVAQLHPSASAQVAAQLARSVLSRSVAVQIPPLQNPSKQSLPAVQERPVAHLLQVVPPQSVSLSPVFLIPFLHGDTPPHVALNPTVVEKQVGPQVHPISS